MSAPGRTVVNRRGEHWLASTFVMRGLRLGRCRARAPERAISADTNAERAARVRLPAGAGWGAGVAVAMVLLFHAGFGWMSGGYAGVSVFFTLSGYLITSLALVEHERAGPHRSRRVLLAPHPAADAGQPDLPRRGHGRSLARSVQRGDQAPPRPVGRAVAGVQLGRPRIRRQLQRAGRRGRPGSAPRSTTTGRWRSRSSSTGSGRSRCS